MTRNKRSTEPQARSVNQRVGNEGSLRKLTRSDAFTSYAMDRLLHRVGRSSQAGEFVLKGGVLVANLVQQPHRFTRDIDFLRRHGPPDPDDEHRMKDILDVVVLAEQREVERTALVRSFQATFTRRATRADPAVLDDMVATLTGRHWESEWRRMVKDKVVLDTLGLRETVAKFDDFVRPIIMEMNC